MYTPPPQSPPAPRAPSHAYPSPRSKSPPPAHRPTRSLPTLRFPLSDLTRFSLAQAASELSSAAPPPRPLRSPIPLFTQQPHTTPFTFRSPIFEPPPPAPAPSFTFEAPARSPRRAAEHPRKWSRRRALPALRSPPPSPRKYAKCGPTPAPPLPTRPAPAPPPSASFPAPPPPPPPPLLAIPRQKRTKRELAELQWQVLLHRSLAWSVRTRREDAAAHSEHLSRAENGFPPGLHPERGGLMIAFATTEPQARWTDALDRDLVRRLWERLLAQGCRQRLQVVIPQSPCVPFPALAPPIELAPPVKCDAPRRARVSAPASPPDFAPASPPDFAPASPPDFAAPLLAACSDEVPGPVGGREGPRVEVPVTPATLLAEGKLSPGMATPPKGVFTPSQLVAQLALRRSLGRAKPMRRGAGGTGPRRASALRET